MFDLVVTFTGLIVFTFGGGYQDPDWVEAVWLRAPQHDAILTYDVRNNPTDKTPDPASPRLDGNLLGRVDLNDEELSIALAGGPSSQQLVVLWEPDGFSAKAPAANDYDQQSYLKWVLPLESLRISQLHTAAFDPPFALASGRLRLTQGTLASSQIAMRGDPARPIVWDFKRRIDGDHISEHSQAVAAAAELRIEGIQAASIKIGERLLTLTPSESDAVGPNDRKVVRVAITNLPGFRSSITNVDSLEHVGMFYRLARIPLHGDAQYRPVVGGIHQTIKDFICPVGRVAVPTKADDTDDPRN